MPSPSTPVILQVLEAARARLDAMELGMMQELGRSWLQIEQRLEADMAALAYEMAERRTAGKIITQQMVWKAERYKALQAQMAAELKKYGNDTAVATISAAQKQYAMLGIDSAQAAINASYGPMGGAFNRINVSAVQSMIGLAGDGSPLRTLLAASYDDAAQGMLDALVNGMARGLGPAQVAREMANGFGMGLDRALLIARTETARAYRTASTEQYRQSGVVTGFKRLVHTSTACLACLMLSGEKFDAADELDDHPNGKAELPGNLIDCPPPSAFITLWHDGDVVVIRTASGKFLAVTKDHPVLTRRGWIAAAFVQEGDDVVSTAGIEWTALGVGPDKHHMPAKVEEIASAFDMLRLGRVPEAAKHLYGNGGDGEVDVVFVNRLLWDGLDAAGKQQVREHLVISGDDAGSFDALGAVNLMLMRQALPASPFLGVEHGGLPFCFGHAAGLQYCGAMAASARDAVLAEYAGDHVTRNVMGPSNGKLRVASEIAGAHIRNDRRSLVPEVSGRFSRLDRSTFGFVPEEPLSLERIRESLFTGVPTSGGGRSGVTGEIVFDRVVERGVSHFAGHVYALQTPNRWYASNTIITHNCIAVPLVEGISEPVWQSGSAYFNSLSAEEQRARMGPGMYKAWKDGEFSLSDLAQKQHSDVWGDSPRVPSLAELVK